MMARRPPHVTRLTTVISHTHISVRALMAVTSANGTLAVMSMSVLIVDDHTPFRTFAHSLLEAEGIEVAGEAADGAAALAAADTLHPDVVLLDINLPTFDGFEVARRLADSGGPKVVLTSSRPASDYGAKLDEAPVAGFLPKQELSGQALLRLVS
jgi:DNA-binding NarL/FixJ family response regulator